LNNFVDWNFKVPVNKIIKQESRAIAGKISASRYRC